jgi:branched-chain amino acid transport system ATP-binding protein
MIGELRSKGLTIMLIEQKARQTLKFAGRAYLLETGRMVTSGTASELARDSIVSEAFLGAGASEGRQAKA